MQTGKMVLCLLPLAHLSSDNLILIEDSGYLPLGLRLGGSWGLGVRPTSPGPDAFCQRVKITFIMALISHKQITDLIKMNILF